MAICSAESSNPSVAIQYSLEPSRSFIPAYSIRSGLFGLFLSQFIAHLHLWFFIPAFRYFQTTVLTSSGQRNNNYSIPIFQICLT
jgi:hypothetical protein